MLLIKSNSLNNIVVTVSQNKTLTSPYYLFSFEHILSKEKVRLYPKNISTSTSRYDEFSFYEGEEPIGYTGDTPYTIFPFEGQYYYSVYEMTSTGTTDPNYAFDKLEEGRALVEDLSNPSEFPYTYTAGNENNENYIYYGEDYNREFLNIIFNESLFNTEQLIWNWSADRYPPLTISNNYTNELTNVPFTITGENPCGYPTNVNTNNIYTI